jgi:hypothetical protein
VYAALWRSLPGSRVAKAGQSLVLALAVLVVCFLWVFPAVAPHMPFNETTISRT